MIGGNSASIGDGASVCIAKPVSRTFPWVFRRMSNPLGGINDYS